MYTSTLLLTAVVNTILAILISQKARTKNQKYFAAVTFLISFWVFSNFFYNLFPRYPMVNLSYAVGALVVIAILAWAMQYTRVPFTVAKKLLLLLALVVPVASVFIKNAVIISDDIERVSYGYNVHEGSYFFIFAVPVVIALLTIIMVLTRSLRQSNGLKKLQTAYVLLGLGVPAVLIIIIDFILPYLGIDTLASFDSILTLLFVIFVSYAIFRYRFVDIRIALSRSAVHFITLAFTLSLYVYLLLLSRDFVTGEYGWSEQTTTIVLVLIIALTFEPLRRSVFHFIHEIFVSREKNAQEEARKMRLLLSTNVQFDSLIEKSLHALQSFFGVSDSNFMYRDPATQEMRAVRNDKTKLPTDGSTYAYLVHSPEIIITEEIPYRLEEAAGGTREQLEKIKSELQQHGIGMVVPIGEPGELFGLFVFGQKEKSEAYTADNIQYIKALQPHMTGAIANALMYKQAMARIGANSQKLKV